MEGAGEFTKHALLSFSQEFHSWDSFARANFEHGRRWRRIGVTTFCSVYTLSRHFQASAQEILVQSLFGDRDGE